MSDSKNSTTQQRVHLSPEARQAITVELGEFFNRIRPGQQAMSQQLAGAIGAARRPPAKRGVMAGNAVRAMHLPEAAVRSAGQGQVTPRDMNDIVRGLGELEPTVLSQLQELGFATAKQADSVIDPRFRFAFEPEVTTESSPGAGQLATQALQTALAAAAFFI